MNRELLANDEISTHILRIQNWQTDYRTITKTFVFSGFLESIKFVNMIAEIAEKLDHHPEILINYKSVKLNLTTHSAGGLTPLDFEFAAHTDKVTK